MKIKLFKINDQYYILIPEDIANAASLYEAIELSVRTEGRAIIIEPLVNTEFNKFHEEFMEKHHDALSKLDD